MKKYKVGCGIRIISVLMCLLMVFTSIPAMSVLAFAQEISALAEDDSPRLELNFNKGWKFNLGDVQNAHLKAYSDSSWSQVNLPHDFSIIQDFTTSGTEGESGSLPGGTGWYRKSFILPAEYEGKSVIINFDASYCETEIYVNGTKIGENLYGYNPFSFDLSKYLVFDGITTNLIAVKVKNPIPTSRWYSGSGLIGDVTLTVVNDVHVSLYGTQITTPNLASSNGTDGKTSVALTMQNDGVTSSGYLSIYGKILNSNGNLVSSYVTTALVNAGSSLTINFSFNDISNPSLWSPENPALYTMQVEIRNANDTVLDVYNTTFGYSWSSWSQSTGFSLNGKNLKLQGVCMHHDQGALGGAQEYDAIYRQLSILKEMGVNSIRTSHNTFSRVYLDICNELGIIVMEEFFDGWITNKNGNSNSFGNHFNTAIASNNNILGGNGMKWYQFVITQTMKRDRNDPSIIVWDVGNELDDVKNTTIAADMKRIVDSLDARPMLWGNNKEGTEQPIDAYMDIYGGNYHLSKVLSNYTTYGKPFVGTETASAVGSRGVYRYTSANYSQTGTSYEHNLNYASSSDYQISAYDAAKVGWGNTAADAWYYTIVNDWFSGEYVWTGFDYIGEPTPWNAYKGANYNYAYPNSSYFGIIDTAGFGKDSYYLYNSFWDKSETTLHLVPGTWNRSNLAVDSSGYVDVAIYSNAPYVELLYNGNVIATAKGNTTTTAAGHKYTTYTETVTNNSLCKVGTLDGSNDHNMYPLFEVKYDAAAQITVKAYESQGGAEITNTVGTKKVYANSAANIVVSAWNNDTTLTADGDSFSYIEITAVDANGNFVNDYNGTVDITLTGSIGAGKIAGVDNGNAATTQKFQSSSALLSDTSAEIQMFNGKALVIVQSTEKTGDINVKVSPTNLAAKSISLKSVAETGDELSDEFEEVIDQTVDVGNLDNQTRYQFLKESIDNLTAPETEVKYELYTLGSGVQTYVPTGSYIIAGADTTGNTSSGVLNTLANSAGTLQTSGKAPVASSQEWYFTRQDNGKYIISFTGQNVTNEFLNISAAGPVISISPQELDVTLSNGTVKIGDGTNYITYSASSANTAGVSTSGTALKLYTVDGTSVSRWGNAGLLEDGQYIIYNSSGYVMTPEYTSNSGSSKTGFVRAEATPDGNIIMTDAANEVTITKTEDSDNGYTFRLSTGKYLNILTTANCLTGESDTAIELYVGEGKDTGDNKAIIYNGVNSSNIAKLLNLFNDSDAQFFCQYQQNIYAATGSNELHNFYRKAYTDSDATVSLYNALTMAVAENPEAYTEESYSNLLDAIQNGLDKYASDTATDAEKNAATAAIDSAYASLEKSAISPTLKEDIENLDPPVSKVAGYFRYNATSGTPIPDGEYILYNQNYVMTGTATTTKNNSNATVYGIIREGATPGSSSIETSDANEITFTSVSSSSNTYYIQNASGQYLNIGSTNNDLKYTNTPQAITVVVNNDGTIAMRYGSIYIDHFTGEAFVFSTYSGEPTENNKKFTLYKKELDTSSDKSALYEAMLNANGVDASLYTTASYTALQRALQEGYNVYTDENATEVQIVNATQAINAAYNALKYANLRQLLQQQIAALTPPAGSEAEYSRYTAKLPTIIPDGDYVISGRYIDSETGGAWGVMTNIYVTDPGVSWTGMGFAASYSDPTIDSNTWTFERDENTGYYQISWINPNNNKKEFLYVKQGVFNNNCYMATTSAASNMNLTWWKAVIDSTTNQITFLNTANTAYGLTFLGESAWKNNNVSDDMDLYVSSYGGGSPVTLHRKENGKLVPWYTPIEDGRYIVTQQSSDNYVQTSNITTNIMNITSSTTTGSFDDVNDVRITDDKITTSVDHELTFTRVSNTTDQYYITNAAGQYLNIGTGNFGSNYNYQLSFTSTPTALLVEADSYGNVYISREMGSASNSADNIYMDHYVNDNIFSTWKSDKVGNQAMRLFRNETTISDGSVQQDLYKKLQDAIAIDKDNYSDESYNNLLVAIKDGIDSYNNDTTNAQWQAAIDAINAAIDALEIAKQSFPATIYKYGYTPNSNNPDFSSGGYDFNTQAYAQMKAKIEATPELMEQIEALVDSVSGTFTGTERQTAIDNVVTAYAKIYTLVFTGAAVNGTGKIDKTSYYETYWNVWEKPGTWDDWSSLNNPQLPGNNNGASVQGLFSTTLDENGLPTSHDAYATLPYVNTNMTSDPTNNDNTMAGMHQNVSISITKGGTSSTVTLPALNNISVYVPDYFSKNTVAGIDETYSKYYWDLQFPFLTYTNNFGVNTYVYDSADTDRVFQASYDDASHTAQAQLTEITGNQGKVSGTNEICHNRGFFPFNNRLDGSNANMTSMENGIYHFGMSFSTEFHIPTNGHYGDYNDIVFEFSGDDDVLVYIDDVLVLDNGGLHGARTANINFTTKTVSYQYIADVQSGEVTNAYNEGISYTYGMENEGISAQNQAAIDYLNKVATDGQQHTFTFYYLERGSTDSNCKISFNIQKISDYLKLYDQTYVVDFGLPVEFNVKENNVILESPESTVPLMYEYIGIAEKVPAAANSLVMFTEPTADDLTFFGSLSELTHEDNFGNYIINKNGDVTYTPKTMSFTDSSSLYLCVRAVNDATYHEDTVYYAFEKVTILPATTIYYEDDFEGDGITYTDGTIPSIETNTEKLGIWQDATGSIPTGVVKGEIYQNADEPGASDANIYGFDQAYTDCATYSGYTSKHVTVSAKNNPNVTYSGGAGSSWPKAEFTFAGTGFDLISVTSKNTGSVQVVVKDADGKQVRNHTVNTYYGYSYGQLYRDANGKETLTETNTPLYFTANRDYTATPTYYAEDGTIVTKNTGDLEFAYAMGWIVDGSIENDNALYQIPIIKVEDLDYGSYTVTITPMYSSRMDMMQDGAYDFYLDAIRVYNPAGVGDSLTNPTISYTYTADNESNPDYLELRNMLIGANKLTNNGTSAKGAVFIDGITDNEDVSKYTSAGPNNELYLQKNQAVAFEIWASAIPNDVQISAKAVGGSQPTMTVSYTSGANTYRADTQVRTSTDLYYSINDLLHTNSSVGYLRWTPVTGSDGKTYYTTGTIVIQNTTDGIISITNLKWTFPSAGIGYYENLENGGAEVVSEPVMLMSNYSTFSLARTALRMDYADLEITEDDVTVENSNVTADESIVIKVKTSTDVDTLVIRDKNGNVITPEAVESYVETIDNKDVKLWQVTLSESEAGTYTYTITGAYENGYESDAEPVVITVTVEKPEEITEPEQPTLFDRLIGFINRIIEFFKKFIALFTGAEI